MHGGLLVTRDCSAEFRGLARDEDVNASLAAFAEAEWIRGSISKRSVGTLHI